MVLNFSIKTFGPYEMRVDYDVYTNMLIVTSINHETNESFVNQQPGELNGRVKFNYDTISAYIDQSWGKALPGYYDKIGFIYSMDDLELRKFLLSDDEYEYILTQYPQLPTHKMSLDAEEKMVRVVSYVTCQELDIVTGLPVEGSQTVVHIDNTEANWYSRESVDPININEVAPEMQSMFENSAAIDPKSMHFFDPIEADIWRKYG